MKMTDQTVGCRWIVAVAAAIGGWLIAAEGASHAWAEEAKPAEMGEKITFEQHILPLFREKCGSCHNANDKKGDLVLDNYGAALRGGGSGEVIKTDGDADGSTLYQVVAHLSEPVMPPGQKLPDDQIALVKKWIEQGALENSGSKAKIKKMAVVAKAEISTQRPAGPPPMPADLSMEPLLISSRANGVTALAVNPWSPLAAVSGHKQVLLYHTSTFDLLGVLPFPEGQPQSIRFSRNGQLLMVAGGRGGHSGKVAVHEVISGKRIALVGDEYDAVLTADISPDQTMIALGGPKKIVRVYDIASGELVYEKNKHTDWVTALEFSPDGVLLATADRSNGLFVWEAYTGREFHVLNGHQGAINDVSWSPDSNLLASASEDSTVKLWEMQNGSQVRNIGAHGGGASAVEFLRDGRLVSFGRDVRAKLWDTSGNNVRTFDPQPDLGTEVVHCAETDRVLVGDLTGQITIYNTADGVKLGQLTTNPAALAQRIGQIQQEQTTVQQLVEQAAQQLAALEKGIADRKAAAATAEQAATLAATALADAQKEQQTAEANLASQAQVLQQAETVVTDAEKARTAAIAARDAAIKAATDDRATVKAAHEALAAASDAWVTAQSALLATPGDANAQAAAKAAAEKLAAAQSAFQQSSNAHVGLVTAAVTAGTNAEPVAAAYATALTARDQALAQKTAAEKTVADWVAKVKTATDVLAVRKAEADKAIAEAVVSPELQKQLTDSSAAKAAAEQRLAGVQQRLQAMQAAVGRPPVAIAPN
jgi:hypothetical protein